MSINLQDGLVGYWPFDEGTGTWYTKDLSSYTNTGYLYYAPPWVSGISGYALDLDGLQEHVRCGNDSSLSVTTGFSFSVWIKPDDISSWGTILAKLGADDAHSAIYVYADSNILCFRVYDSTGGKKSVTSSTIYIDNWYHVVGTYDGSSLKLYVNGVLVDTESSVPSINTNINHVWIGSNERWSSEQFDGIIDEVRYYNRALNATEVNYLYKNPSGTNTDISSALLVVTDLNGDMHAITENIENLSISSALSYSNDTFTCDLANYDDEYDFIEFGCEIEIYLGMGGYNTKRLAGIITDAVYTLDDNLIEGRIEISGEDIGYRLNNIYVFVIIEEEKEISDILKIVLETVDVTTDKSYLTLADIDNDYTYIESSDYLSEKTIFAWTPLSTVFRELAEYAGFEWYIDVDKKLHFFDQYDTSVSATITDTDLCSNPRISVYEKTINRGIVLGGYIDKVDQTGVTKDAIATVTSTTSKTTSFTPTNNMLYSVDIWTELRSPFDSDIILKIYDSDSDLVSGSTKSVYKDDIVDGGYTRFLFESFVYLVVGKPYLLSVEGTDAVGVNVGVGKEPPHRIAYITNYPVRVSAIENDMDSYDRHGIYMDIYVDEHIEDQSLAAGKAYSMLNGDPKQMANVAVHDDTIIPGDVVTLTLTTPGITINKNMKVMRSTISLKKPFIENKLELKEE